MKYNKIHLNNSAFLLYSVFLFPYPKPSLSPTSRQHFLYFEHTINLPRTHTHTSLPLVNLIPSFVSHNSLIFSHFHLYIKNSYPPESLLQAFTSLLYNAGAKLICSTKFCTLYSSRYPCKYCKRELALQHISLLCYYVKNLI